MYYRCTRWLCLLLFSFFPAAAFAGEFDVILGDLNKFEEDMQWQIQAEIRALEDHDFQESSELFLQSEADIKSSGLEPANQFVTVKINGIPVTFSDVPADAWFAPYVRSAAESNIISGYKDEAGRLLGSFGPADDVTVEQLAKIALQASGVVIQDCAGVPQNNTATGSWAAHYIACAEDFGWALYSDGSVDVQRPATRSEVVVTMIQAFDVSFGRGSGELFDDITASTEFSGAIEQAANDGVVSGYADDKGQPTGQFGPTDSVNRAEVAKIITLAKNVYGR